jgi:hypothetical protein
MLKSVRIWFDKTYEIFWSRFAHVRRSVKHALRPQMLNYFSIVWPLRTNYAAPNTKEINEYLRWWAHQDLNLGPADYESDALTN